MKSAALTLANVSIVPAAVAAVLAVCLLSLALPARAASLTSDQLSNVQALLQSYGVADAKIQAVSAVLSDNGAAGTAASSTPCAAPARALVKGMRSDDVTTLQTRLVDEGYLTEDNATGYFGSSTEAALKQWQADQGIVATGTPETTGWGAVGQKTIQALGKCEVRKIENRAESGANASSSPAMPVRPGQPAFPGGSGTPVPQAAPQDGTQSAAGAVGEFLSDYSDSFNQNLAAVASAPFNFYVPILSDFFYSVGIH